MHDPMCVAWEVPFPLPRRVKWRDAREGQPRWTFGRMRRTNEENRGEPVYRWWRPAGWHPVIAGRGYELRTFAIIWHVEPNGHDSGEVCKHAHRWQDADGDWQYSTLRAWRWHVHHWSIQVPLLQSWRARLFDRCALCGRKGRPNVSHRWDFKRLGWRKWRSREGLYHRECFEVVTRRRSAEQDKAEAELLDHLRPGMEFADHYRLERLLGWERDDNYRLVKKAGS